MEAAAAPFLLAWHSCQQAMGSQGRQFTPASKIRSPWVAPSTDGGAINESNCLRPATTIDTRIRASVSARPMALARSSNAGPRSGFGPETQGPDATRVWRKKMPPVVVTGAQGTSLAIRETGLASSSSLPRSR